jgi:hypothetical protein
VAFWDRRALERVRRLEVEVEEIRSRLPPEVQAINALKRRADELRGWRQEAAATRQLANELAPALALASSCSIEIGPVSWPVGRPNLEDLLDPQRPRLELRGCIVAASGEGQRLRVALARMPLLRSEGPYSEEQICIRVPR